MIEINTKDKTEFDLRAEAAECMRQYRAKTGKWPPVMSWAEWERVGFARGQRDKCGVIEGMKREGYVHPYANLVDPGRRGNGPNRLTLKLTQDQKAQRAQAWSESRGVPIVEALRYLGFAR